MYDIYSTACNDLWRFTLGKNGSRKLFTIGLNPSTATKEKSDTTVAKVERAAKRNGFDGFVMLNLYPIRSTNFNHLPISVDEQAFSENIDRIEKLISSEPRPATIWAAWGINIDARTYFISSIKELSSRLHKYGSSWQHFGSLTNAGHPRHPSRLSYQRSFTKFDIEHYVHSLKSPSKTV